MPNMSVVFPPSDFGPMHPKSMPKEMLQAVLMIIVSRLRSGRCAIAMPTRLPSLCVNIRAFIRCRLKIMEAVPVFRTKPDRERAGLGLPI